METLFAKSAPEWTPLKEHLIQVASAATAFADYLKMDREIAHNGALLHDIGKAHPRFQQRLRGKDNSGIVFRHEISSLLFLSVFPEEQRGPLLETVVGHHKSVRNDAGDKGLLDLEEGYDYQDFHIGDWDAWSPAAFALFHELGVPSVAPFDKTVAGKNLVWAVRYCRKKVRERGYSEWRGLLMGADHFASALIGRTESQLERAFRKPDLGFYDRRHELYPLSYRAASSSKRHSLVVACTGAGKTDFLFRRTRGRVFYTLPFQASINAMYHRVSRDLEKSNPGLDIRVLHASSSVVRRKKEAEEAVLQPLFGSSIKILTPHQLAAIAFGLKGYEALLLDLKGCDIILDEIHTYSGISQAIVLKLVQVLQSLHCRIHIGTATMPSELYRRILDLLGRESILEVKLSDEEMDGFDRHRVHKLASFEEAYPLIDEAMDGGEKVLLVCNRVAKAQEIHRSMRERYPHIDILLLHSRFKRGDRNEKEKELLGLDVQGRPLGRYNTGDGACIVVSTQIVEVSLDISFDRMVTECAPIDALVQRFGRINRKRSQDRPKELRPVHVIAPPSCEKEALPYDLEVLNRSFAVLPDGNVLRERDLQEYIDTVFPSIDFMKIEEHSVFKSDGSIRIDKLTHRSRSILFELLDIDSVVCITESDEARYAESHFEDRLNLEIPVRYFSVREMRQSDKGHRPFIIPDGAYSRILGLEIGLIDKSKFDTNLQFL